MSTTIRIENFFWNTQDEIAARGQMTVNQLITKLYFDSIDAEHDLGNFASFLRVCCARYHCLIGMGEISASLLEELGNVSAPEILERGQVHYENRQELLERLSRNNSIPDS